ncbi:MAG: hypothetical protein DMG57_31550 [Acidobacteria bacterium]|nr:MAG: hypothetical protein DMG57_31550 [Acidobacteriota bacterium]
MRICLLVQLLSACCLAQTSLFAPNTVRRLRQVMDEIYRLNHAKAAALCEQMIAQAPGDPIGYVYLARTYWALQLYQGQELTLERFAASDFFSETPGHNLPLDPVTEARFRKASLDAVTIARTRLNANAQDQQARYLLGLAYQNMASYDASLRRDWWSALRHGSKTYKYHRELLAREPEFADARLTVGVYHYLAGSLTWKTRWLAYLLGFQGNKQRGIAELETAAGKGLLAADDARTLLVLIYTREHEPQKAFQKLDELNQKFQENYLVPLAMGAISLRMEEPERAIAIYSGILNGTEHGKYPRLEKGTVYNRLGVAHQATGDFTSAVDWFQLTIDAIGGSERSKTIARLELGKTLDLMGRRSDAVRYYQTVASASDFAGSREEAGKLLARPYRR